MIWLPYSHGILSILVKLGMNSLEANIYWLWPLFDHLHNKKMLGHVFFISQYLLAMPIISSFPQYKDVGDILYKPICIGYAHYLIIFII